MKTEVEFLPGTVTPDHSGSRDEQTASATAPLTTFRAAYVKASRAWNMDGGPIEHTVKAGEDLYFAGHNLIDALDERCALLAAALGSAANSVQVNSDAVRRGGMYSDKLATVLDQIAKSARAAIAKATGADQ